jgi:hypothetical protein
MRDQRVNEGGRSFFFRKKEEAEAMGAEDQSEMRGTAEQAPGASLHL